MEELKRVLEEEQEYLQELEYYAKSRDASITAAILREVRISVSRLSHRLDGYTFELKIVKGKPTEVRKNP